MMMTLVLLQDQSDGGMSPRGTDNMKLDLVVENNRLRLRLARMERELQGLEDKFSAAQVSFSFDCGSLVESTPFVRRVVSSNPALATTEGPWASPSLAVACGASGVKLRHSIRAVWGAPLSSSGLQEAL